MCGNLQDADTAIHLRRRTITMPLDYSISVAAINSYTCLRRARVTTLRRKSSVARFHFQTARRSFCARRIFRHTCYKGEVAQELLNADRNDGFVVHSRGRSAPVRMQTHEKTKYVRVRERETELRRRSSERRGVEHRTKVFLRAGGPESSKRKARSTPPTRLGGTRFEFSPDASVRSNDPQKIAPAKTHRISVTVKYLK